MLSVKPKIFKFSHSNFYAMLIEFQIAYKTWYGQQLMIVGSHPLLGSGSMDMAVSMDYSPEELLQERLFILDFPLKLLLLKVTAAA